MSNNIYIKLLNQKNKKVNQNISAYIFLNETTIKQKEIE